MELRQLQTFLKVAEHLNFTRAAETLSYAQSSVTAHVAALESEFGVLLFERLGKRVVLTEAGIRLRSYADQLVRLADEAVTAVRAFEEPAGNLVIGSPESLCTYRLPAVLRAFRQLHPNVQIVFRPGICNDLKRDISEGLLDLAFILEDPQELPPLVFEPLIPEDLLVLAAPDHPLAARLELSPADLQGQTILVTEAGCTYRLLWEGQIAGAKARPETVMEFASVEAIKQCTMEGIGVTVLPSVAVQAELRSGRLQALPWSWEGAQLATQMVWHRDKWRSPAIEAFMAIARQTLQAPGFRRLPAEV